MKNTIIIEKTPRYLSLLSMLCVTFWLICLVGQYRLVSIYSGYVTATIFTYPFVCCLLDIIAEIYGYKVAKKTLWSALASLYLFAITMTLFAKLPTPLFWDNYTNHFNATMSVMFRTIVIASISIIVGQYINIFMISKLYFLTKGKFFGLRSIGSTIVGDTITFILSIWGYFIGKMSGHEILVIIFDELLIMYVMAILLAIPASIIVSILKKIEPNPNLGININPFRKE